MSIKKNILIGLLSLSLLLPTTVFANSNQDVTEQDVEEQDNVVELIKKHWAGEDLFLAYIGGYFSFFDDSENIVNPNLSITKFEFIKKLMTFDDFEGYLPDIIHKKETTLPYKDVNKENPYFDYVLKAYEYGLLNNEDNLKGNDFITREEVASLVAKFYSYIDKSNVTIDNNIVFKDQKQIGKEYINDVLYLNKLNIITGKSNLNKEKVFAPKNNMSIAESIKVISNLRNALYSKGYYMNEIASTSDGIVFYNYQYGISGKKYIGFHAVTDNEKYKHKKIEIGYVEETVEGFVIHYKIVDDYDTYIDYDDNFEDVYYKYKEANGLIDILDVLENNASIFKSYLNPGSYSVLESKFNKEISKENVTIVEDNKRLISGYDRIKEGIDFILNEVDGKITVQAYMGGKPNTGYAVDIDSIHVDQDINKIFVLYSVKEPSYDEINANVLNYPKSNEVSIDDNLLGVMPLIEYDFSFNTFTTVLDEKFEDVQFKYYLLPEKVIVHAKMDEKTTTGYYITLDGLKNMNNKLTTYYKIERPLEDGFYAQYINSPETSRMFFIDNEINENTDFDFKKEQPYMQYKYQEIVDNVVDTSYNVYSYKLTAKEVIDNAISNNVEMTHLSTYNSDSYINYTKINDKENNVFEVIDTENETIAYKNQNVIESYELDRDYTSLQYANVVENFVELMDASFYKVFKEDDNYYYIKFESYDYNGSYDFKINKKNYLIEQIEALMDDSSFDEYFQNSIHYSSFNAVESNSVPVK